MRLHLILPVALLLAGCADGKVTAAETVLTACQTYNSALSTVTALNNAKPLSARQVEAVDKSVALSGGVCDGPAPKVDATALDIIAVQGASALLNAVIGGK